MSESLSCIANVIFNINLIGLIFGFSGAFVLFVFNNPYRGKASYWTSKETVEKDRVEANRLRIWQKIGFILMAIGFLLQIVSVVK